MWSDERALIVALIALVRERISFDGNFMLDWRHYAHGENPYPLTEEQAEKAIDWLEDRLEMPVNPDA